jgi:hypothetical protein
MARKLTLEEMVKFVREVADAALEEKRAFEAGVLVQRADNHLCVLMFDRSVKQDELARAMTEFIEENGADTYVYMSALTRRTQDIFIYAAARAGERVAKRWAVSKGLITEHPHEEVHRFLELFPKTLH